MRKTICVTIASILLIVSGCGENFDPFDICDDCNDSISDYVELNGLPSEIDSYEADNYWSVTYWYWCQGVARTWVQTPCNCDESTYTFSPICP